MSREHGLILTEGEMTEIINIVREMSAHQLPAECRLFQKEDTYACPNINVCQLCKRP
jgi:hypothetical protein